SSVFRPLFGPAPQSAIPRVTEKKTESVPEAITRPMPVTLHALAAARGRPVQVFPANVASSVDVQIPRSSALPLRPVMTLEAAPAAVKMEEPQADEMKPAERTPVVTQDPRPAGSNTREPEAPEAKAPEKMEPVAAPVVEKKAIDKKIFEETTAGKKIDPAPEPKLAEPKQETKPEPNPDAPRELPVPLAKPYTPPDLGLPSLMIEPPGFFSKVSTAGKLALAALIVIAAGAAIYLTTKSGSADAAAVRAPRVVETQAPALSAGDSAWITDWGAEPGVRRQHDISVLRPSMSLTDYRMEFQAQIEHKTLGWIYRARDGKNYYVSRLEIVKPGLNPTVALIRFAVINGQEQPHAEVPLPIPVHLETVYSIRFDAVGDRFTTFVEDQKVDDFTDDRIKTGGVGLYNEHGEQPGLKGPVRVVPLVIKK
ncbi:MAG TPA: hypothetical protein VK419_13790, partial [Bryobacteraceae bacterium]|nr:hypothetical protein [Bryobacteraceae bacterium]